MRRARSLAGSSRPIFTTRAVRRTVRWNATLPTSSTKWNSRQRPASTTLTTATFYSARPFLMEEGCGRKRRWRAALKETRIFSDGPSARLGVKSSEPVLKPGLASILLRAHTRTAMLSSSSRPNETIDRPTRRIADVGFAVIGHGIEKLFRRDDGPNTVDHRLPLTYDELHFVS